MLRKSLPLHAFRAPAALIALTMVCGIQTSQAGTLVTINTNLGAIKVDLFNEVAPTTVTNFVNLVAGGNFTNTIIHRSSPPNKVIQGGGFDTSFAPIDNNGDIPLEYTVAHVRGTIGMARSTLPNSANSQWFINTGDNSTAWAPNGQSAGYAAFGWVVSGMNVVDQIAALPRFNLGNQTDFTELPLQNYTNGNQIQDSNKIIVQGVSITEQHPSFQNPIWNVDVDNSYALTTGEDRVGLSTSDVMVIVEGIVRNGRRHSADATRVFESTYQYFDTNGDNFVSTSDLMMVVNAILRGDTAPAGPLAAMADPMAAPLTAPLAVVPEPSSLVLGILGCIGLGTLAVRRHRASRRSAAKAA